MNIVRDDCLLIYGRSAYIIIAMHIFSRSLSVRQDAVVTATTSDIEFVCFFVNICSYLLKTNRKESKDIRREKNLTKSECLLIN